MPSGLDKDSPWCDLGRVVRDHQRKDGCARGSFDPVDVWSPDGGRVYSTAMIALALANQLGPK
jgi:hypothetical protein